MVEFVKQKIKDFPLNPGVYIMKDKNGEIIYIGKAKQLRKRVRSYFSGEKDIKTRVLVKHIHTIDYIISNSEYEALLLENNLIKQHTPRYNIDLKDDKSYPVICITKEDFPRIFKTRTVKNDGSAYYGPFTSTEKLDNYLRLINSLFPIRKCRGKLKKRESPCLYYHIGKCSAPCCGKISKEDYAAYVKKAKRLLSGKTKGLVRDLEKAMNKASKNLDFEKAAILRDQISSVKMVSDQGETIDFDSESRDYIACYTKNSHCTFSVIQIRKGRITDKHLFHSKIYGDEEDAFTEFFLHHYDKDSTIPGTIYISGTFDPEAVRIYVNQFTNEKITISTPTEGKHLKIMSMNMENARQDVERRVHSLENTEGLKELKNILKLPRIPKRIEGFDIAQLSGKYPVSSLVSFYNGIPDKKNYRKFHIKTLKGAIDDYEAIREVVARRYTRVINDNLERPDLIVIDGGKGQVNAAKGILVSLGLSSIPVIGLAKRNEEIFLPDISEPVILPETSPALKIVQAVRDETHRFATNFNKQLRKKGAVISTFEAIPGVGPKYSQALLKEFGSLENIIKTPMEDISKRTGIPTMVAEKIEKYLKKFDIPGKRD